MNSAGLGKEITLPTLATSHPLTVPAEGPHLSTSVCTSFSAPPPQQQAGEGTWRGQRGPGDGPRLPAAWDAHGLRAGGSPVRPGVRRTGANRAERSLVAAKEEGEGRRTRVGTGQGKGRWPGPLNAWRRTRHSIYRSAFPGPGCCDAKRGTNGEGQAGVRAGGHREGAPLASSACRARSPLPSPSRSFPTRAGVFLAGFGKPALRGHGREERWPWA